MKKNDNLILKESWVPIRFDWNFSSFIPNCPRECCLSLRNLEANAKLLSRERRLSSLRLSRRLPARAIGRGESRDGRRNAGEIRTARRNFADRNSRLDLVQSSRGSQLTVHGRPGGLAEYLRSPAVHSSSRRNNENSPECPRTRESV